MPSAKSPAARLIISLVSLFALLGFNWLSGASGAGPESDPDTLNALEMVEDQLQLLSEAGASQTDESYTALLGQREEILRAELVEPRDSAAAARDLGSAEAVSVPAVEVTCEAIPPFRIDFPEPARCLTLPRQIPSYLYIVLSANGEALVFVFRANGVPTLERQPIPRLPQLSVADVTVDEAGLVTVSMPTSEVVVDTRDWGLGEE